MFPNLKLQIWRSGIRQNRLAQIVGIDETVLSRIINGFREPSPEVRQRIASTLNCDAVWLFEKTMELPAAAAKFAGQESAAQKG